MELVLKPWKEIGRLIKRRRILQGLSQEQLATQMGLRRGQGEISKWENGKPMVYATLSQLAGVLTMNWDELIERIAGEWPPGDADLFGHMPDGTPILLSKPDPEVANVRIIPASTEWRGQTIRELEVVPVDAAGLPIEDEIDEYLTWIPGGEYGRRWAGLVPSMDLLEELLEVGKEEKWGKDRLDRIRATRDRLVRLQSGKDPGEGARRGR